MSENRDAIEEAEVNVRFLYRRSVSATHLPFFTLSSKSAASVLVVAIHTTTLSPFSPLRAIISEKSCTLRRNALVRFVLHGKNITTV